MPSSCAPQPWPRQQLAGASSSLPADALTLLIEAATSARLAHAQDPAEVDHHRRRPPAAAGHGPGVTPSRLATGTAVRP